jgi:hypothetical protein
MSSSRSTGSNPFNFSLSDITSKVGDFFGSSEFSNPVGMCYFLRAQMLAVTAYYIRFVVYAIELLSQEAMTASLTPLAVAVL